MREKNLLRLLRLPGLGLLLASQDVHDEINVPSLNWDFVRGQLKAAVSVGVECLRAPEARADHFDDGGVEDHLCGGRPLALGLLNPTCVVGSGESIVDDRSGCHFDV